MDAKQVTIKADVLKRLEVRAHYEQSINGVIKELLDKVEEIEAKEEK